MEDLLTEAAPLLSGIISASPAIRRPAARAIIADHLSVSTVDTIAGLEGLAEEWRALERAPRSKTTPFQTYAFHREWVRHFVGTDIRFRVITVRDDEDRLVLILPLAIQDTPLGRTAGWIGDPLIQYGDVVCAPDCDPSAWLDAALCSLTADGDIAVLVLRNVRADAAAVGWLGRRATRTGRVEKAVAIDLKQFDDPADFARSNAKWCKHLRRRRKRLAARGTVEFRVLGGGQEAVARVDQAIAMKNAWLHSRGLMGRAFADPRVQACLEALVADGRRTGAGVFSLDVDGRPAAIEIGFCHNGRHCAFLGAFDLDFARCSPGQIEIEETINWSIGHRATVYDLMAPADAYKREIGTIETEIGDYTRVMVPAGIPAALWSNYGPRTLKATFNRLPRRLRTAIRSGLS